MSSGRSHGCLLGVIGVYVLASSASSWGSTEDMAARRQRWRDFGTLLLYQRGTGRCPSAEWLNWKLDVVDPDSRQAVRTVESLLSEALDGYGRDAIAIERRIPLDVNPQCILGLYLAERFSGTRLGDWGYRQFGRCVEQACLVATSAAGGTWRAIPDTEWLAMSEPRDGPSPAGAFAPAETPYLYLYLIREARSADVRNEARDRLARRLWQGYGLELGLRQYLILFDQGYEVDGTWLEVATQLEQTAAHSGAKRIYRRVLTSTESVEEARMAFERLAHILLLESRPGEARMAWGVLSRRFPHVECTAPDVKGFLNDFQLNRAQTGQRLLGELARTTDGPQALRVCRLFDALWMPEEACQQWQAVVEKAEPGGLADQLGRVFLAGAMLDATRVDEAENLVRGLTESSNPFVQALSVTVSAEVAQARGDVEESTRRYSRAVQIDRQTPLPSWCKELIQVASSDANIPATELQTQRLFLKGCSHLIDGDCAGAADNLSQVVADPRCLPEPLRRVLPCVTMLAYLGIEDYAQAEAWGYRALETCQGERPDDARTREFLAKVQSLDSAVSQLAVKIRQQANDEPAASAALQDAINICDAGAALGSSGSHADGIAGGVQQLYARAKRRHVARVLTAEYHHVRRRSVDSRAAERSSSLLPLLFAAQVLSESSFERIKERLSSAPDTEEAMGRLYRFAVFAQRVKRMDLAGSALDAAASEKSSAGNIEILEGIAEMYLAASNHQKAIESYERIAANAKDPAKARTVLLRIIDLYAGDLKNYDKAVQECEEFLRRYPDGPQTSQVEFLLGKYAYLRKDYSGAVGQLDSFRKKYPEHHQVGQGMMLAGLSRMAEGNTQEAVSRFNEIIRRYPDDDLAARSKFLIGYAQVSDQKYAAALETFRQLLEQFPRSPYVAQAQNLIDRLSRVSQ